MFRTRLISGILLLLLAILFIRQGGLLLAFVTGVISLIGMFELYRVFAMEKSLLAGLSYLALPLYYWNLHEGPLDSLLFAMLYLSALLAAYVFSYPKYHARQLTASFFGFFYVAVCLSYLYLMREMPGGSYLVWLIFLASWGCDTCAYAVGVLFGKHKMAPVLSPKKSIEGAVGGLVGAALLTALYLYCLRMPLHLTSGQIAGYTLAVALASLISMVGDLAASAIKRNYEIKDYGNLIPGHGGILDRFDSVIITAPVVFAFIRAFVR